MATPKLQYNPKLQYQLDAIRSVVNLFKGLPKSNTGEFTAPRQSVALKGLEVSDKKGISNRFASRLSDDALLANIQDVQRNNFLPRDKKQDNKPISMEFDIEMETGTGKTYVYLRTIHELHQAYGFSKFLILVPTLPIRAGIAKSLETMHDHFQALYPTTFMDKPIIYENGKLQYINAFAESANLSIMVMTIQAINSANNIINQAQDSLNGCKPFDILRETHPIVIVDEPQKFGSTDSASQEAIRKLEPLFVLNYSATHRDKHSLVYKLGPVESYQQKLVKKIQVWGEETSVNSNTPDVLLVSINNKGKLTAKIKTMCIGQRGKKKGQLEPKTIEVGENDSLREATHNDAYDGYVVREIHCDGVNEYVEFDNGIKITKGQNNADNSALAQLRRLMIRETIKEHLRRERELLAKGIKVLSLFFIDSVDKYVDKNNHNARTGEYARIFEEEYDNEIKRADHKRVREYWEDLGYTDAKTFHNGYFSVDGSGKAKDTKSEEYDGEASDADKKANAAAIDQILKKKEELLSVTNPLRFVFSHSALQEGWDNPNVFQICSLADIKKEVSRRQKIGRGLRLPVKQVGDRFEQIRDDENINVLTVFANESVSSFAKKLQKNYEDETGVQFGRVNMDAFKDLVCIGQDGKRTDISPKAAECIEKFLKDKGYLEDNGDVTDALRKALNNNTFELPDYVHDDAMDEDIPIKDYEDEVSRICKQACVRIEVCDAKDRVDVKMVDSKRASFEALWDRIKAQTQYYYDEHFNTSDLIEKCANSISKATFPELRISHIKAEVDVTTGGVQAKAQANSENHERIDYTYSEYPDILSELQRATSLKRDMLAKIIEQSGTIKHFIENPRGYIETILPIITSDLEMMQAQAAIYYLTGKDLDRSIFEEELHDYKDDHLLTAANGEITKSLFDHVRCQSQPEHDCVEMFERDANVKLYAKLPPKFIIPTPVNVDGYNPDWAVIAGDDDNDRLYFVYESKSSNLETERRPKENAKIACAKKHFAVISGNGARVCFKAGKPESMRGMWKV